MKTYREGILVPPNGGTLFDYCVRDTRWMEEAKVNASTFSAICFFDRDVLCGLLYIMQRKSPVK